MTQVGEGVATGGGRDPNIEDLDDDHWLELEYHYRSGRSVYGHFRATDSDGMIWIGRLNDQGQVCLAGLPPGNVNVELLPEANLERDIEQTRASIQEVLDQILTDQREEAAAYERDLEQMGGPQRAFAHIQAAGHGAWNGAVGLLEFVGKTAYKAVELSYYLSPANLLGDTLRASYQSYQEGELTWDQWYDSVHQNLQDEHKKDLARLFGVEPDDISEERLRELMNLIAEAYDIAAFIADDEPTRQMLLEFAQELADSQSSVEWAEFAGAGVFEIVLGALLAIFTGGAGNVAQAATQLRHASRLRGLGHLFRQLANQLRRKKLNKTIEAPVDQRTTTRTDQPDAIRLTPRSELPEAPYALQTDGAPMRTQSGKVPEEFGEMRSVPNTTSESRNVFHATTSPQAAQGVINGVDPKFLNPNSRFGAAFYVGEEPGTTLSELTHHGVSPTHGIRFEFNSSGANILDLTDPDIAKAWNYNGGPISSATQEIGIKASEQGFNAIRYYSERNLGGINNAILDNFDELLTPQFVSPAEP